MGHHLHDDKKKHWAERGKAAVAGKKDFESRMRAIVDVLKQNMAEERASATATTPGEQALLDHYDAVAQHGISQIDAMFAAAKSGK